MMEGRDGMGEEKGGRGVKGRGGERGGSGGGRAEEEVKAARESGEE